MFDYSGKFLLLRKKYKLSQKDLAVLAEVGQTTISDIESGKKTPNTITIEKICTGLGITMVEFFTNDEVTSKNIVQHVIDHANNMDLSDEQKEDLEDYKKMPPEEQQRRFFSNVVRKLESLPAADQEALIRLINSLSRK